MRIRVRAALCGVVLLLCAVEGGDMSEDLMRRSQEMVRESFKAEAEGRLNDALKIAAKMPQDAFSVFRQGKLLLKLGEYNEAYHALTAAANAAPLFPSFLAYKAYMQAKVGEVEQSALTCVTALNNSLLDFRASVVLNSLPPEVKAKHTALLDRVRTAAREAHLRGGHASAAEFAGTVKGGQGGHVRELVFVTSANSLYFQCVSNLIGSLQLREPGAEIDLYDIGFDEFERLVARSWAGVHLIQFPFEAYPAHVRNLRTYAWKPLVYQHALQRRRIILYQDSGQELWQQAGDIERLIARDGHFFVMQGEKTLPEKVHPSMIQTLGMDPRALKGKDMCAGGIQGYRNDSAAVSEVLLPVVECALKEDCMAPRGADQSNHRFDQAAFSVIIAHHKYRCHCSWQYRAYLESTRLKDADTFDVLDGFGTVTPLLFSRRCDQPQAYFPLTHAQR